MKIEIEVDDEEIGALFRPVARKLQDDPETRRRVAEFAVDQLVGWMSGRLAYQSITQQYTEWLTELLPVFFDDQPPSTSQIFNSFNVPYGRAAYISRVLLEKQQTIWRQRGRETLQAALKASQAEADQNVQRKDGTKYVQVAVNALAERELSALLDALYDEDANRRYAVRRMTSPGRYLFDIPSAQFAPLIEMLS